ncbi:MAG TPA: ABC transporter permease [Alphaproteobacteria bacterium]|nr:ABC transporter permease [Alphaproteobacteria bacterium]
MKEYIIKKLLLLIPTVLAITFLVFSMMHFIPGDPIFLLLGDMYDQRQADELRREHGLDKPLIVQYAWWLARLVQGDWGRSIFTHRPVLDDIVYRIPISLELIVLSMLLALLIAVPAGVISAIKPYTALDYSVMTLAMVGVSMPDFFLGILLFLLFSLTLGWLPVQGYVPMADGVINHFSHLILPAVALGLARCAILTRLIRASMLEVVKLDYVTTARAKGVVEFLVVNKHALKNALIPTITVLGLQIGFLIGGAIVIEAVFGIPGLGTFGVQGITKRDYQQVQGFILIVALMFVFSNLLVDISYAYFDPRIRYEGRGK